MTHFKELLEAKSKKISKKRANEILNNPVRGEFKLSQEERNYVNKVWDKMDGSSSFATALKSIADGSVNEGRVHRAIFFYDGDEATAQKCVNNKIWDYVEEQENVTIETVNVYEGDDESESMIHFVGMNQYPEKAWKGLVREVESKFKKLSFERFA